MPERLSAIAGTFYKDSPEALREQVASYLPPTREKVSATAVLIPHAGLHYSGNIAGAVYASLTLPDTIILLGPNHRGTGAPLALFPEGNWHIPGTKISIATDLAQRLLTLMPNITSDERAHRDEHCLEVQLPFLCYLRPNIRILPLLVSHRSISICQELGECLTTLITEATASSPTSTPPLLVATTDFNHYESDAVTRQKDHFALEAIAQLDPPGLYNAVTSQNISMCGLGPTLATLYLARAVGLTRGTLIRYGTSGDINGDLQRVVGYGGFIFSDNSTS